MSEESHAVAVPSPRGQLVPQWWADSYGPRTMYHTTLDLRDPAQKAILLRALTEDCTPAKDVLNVPMDIVAYTLSPAGRELEGELQEWVRCVLHLAGGQNVAAGSMGLIRSLMMIEQLDRPAPWHPPMTCVLKARDLGNGKQWYSLVLPASGSKASGKKG